MSNREQAQLDLPPDDGVRGPVLSVEQRGGRQYDGGRLRRQARDGADPLLAPPHQSQASEEQGLPGRKGRLSQLPTPLALPPGVPDDCLDLLPALSGTVTTFGGNLESPGNSCFSVRHRSPC